MPRCNVEVAHFAEKHRAIRLALQNPAKRGGDVRRRECAGRHLIQERPKQMKVAPIDERHVDASATKRAGRIQTRESTADDHNTVLRSGRHRLKLLAPGSLLPAPCSLLIPAAAYPSSPAQTAAQACRL